MQAGQSVLEIIQKDNWNCMDISLEWVIFVGKIWTLHGNSRREGSNNHVIVKTTR